MIQRRPSLTPGMILCSSMAYTAKRPMFNRCAISGIEMRTPDGTESWLVSGLDMALFLDSYHLRAEWVMGLYAPGFAGPFVLALGSVHRSRQIVLCDC